MDTEDLSFRIRRKDIKVRKKWDMNPGTKVEPAKKKKREKDTVRRQIEEEIDMLGQCQDE